MCTISLVDTLSYCRGKHRRQQLRKNLQVVHALEWPDRELISKVEEEFPDAGVASVEEARVRSSRAS